MRHPVRVTPALLVLTFLIPGCGSDETSRTSAAGTNRRAFEKYKNLIDKDGKPIWKPGMTTKKMPTAKSKS